VSHYFVSREKFAALRCGLSTKFFDHSLLHWRRRRQQTFSRSY